MVGIFNLGPVGKLTTCLKWQGHFEKWGGNDFVKCRSRLSGDNISPTLGPVNKSTKFMSLAGFGPVSGLGQEFPATSRIDDMSQTGSRCPKLGGSGDRTCASR